jgi:hypothetical protein
VQPVLLDVGAQSDAFLLASEHLPANATLSGDKACLRVSRESSHECAEL